MNSNQLNNSNNKQLFSNQPSSSISSMIFMSTSSQNDHPITISSTQQKRKQFENKIRQQSRNRFKQNLRKKQQLQLLKSMGIQTHQHEHQHGQQYDNHSYYDNQQQHQGQQQRQQQLFEQIQQQADNIVVEYFTNFSYTNSNSYNHNSNNNINSNGDNNHQQQQQQDQTIDSSNNMYLRRSYQEIQQYKQKEFCQDPMKLWKHIQKGIQQYMKSSTISLSKRTTKTNHILNNNNTIQWLIETLRAINHILVMEMFYSQIEWVQFRCVHPQQYNGIFEWLWVVYCEYIRQYQQQQQQSSQRDNNNNNVFFQQMKQSISTLILILICYQLKIQGCTVKQRPFQQYTTSTYTLSNHRDNNNNNNNNNNRDNNSNSNNSNSNSNSNTKRRKLWQNRILFEQLLQVQWLWSHWSVIKMSNVIDLNVYCIGKMLGIVDKQSKKIEVEIDSFNNNKDNNNNNNYINFHKKQTSNLINHLLNISTLVQNIKQLITTIVIKINNYNKLNIYNIGYNNNNSNSNNQGCYGEFVYQNRLKNIVMKVYEVIGGVNGVLSGMSGMVNMVDNSNGSINMNQRSSVNNNQQSTIPSLVFIKSLQLLFITDRLFAIINSHQQQNHYLQRQHQQYQQQQQQHQQQQQSLIRRQLQKHYQTLVKHTLLQKDHYVYLYLGQDDKMMRNNRKDIKRDMECFYKEFVGVKLITMTEILTLSLQSVCRQQYNSNNNQQNKYQHHQQNTTIPSYNPFQLKCLSLSLTTIIHMFEQQHTLINNLLQSTYYQQINSIQHLCELFKKIKNGQCNNDSSSVGVYLVLMCKQLLGVIGEMVIRIVNVDVDANVNVDVDANVNVNGKKHQHSQSSQFVIKNNQQSLLVSILLMAIKAINTIAEVQQLNIFKYSCLLYQAVAMSRTKQNRWQQNQRKHQKQQQQKQQQIFPSRSSKSLIELSHLFLQYLNNNFNNKKNKNNKNNSNKNYKNSNKNMRLVDIKQQLGLFVQNIVYNQFPLQTHFEEFSIKKSNNESNVKEVGRLVESYQELTRNSKNNKTAQQSRITTKQHHHLHSIFTQPYLDNQTNQLLQTVQSLLQQSCIQTQLQAIKIVNLLILMCDNKSAFNYFVQKIKSQTEIYKIVEFMAQQAGHDKVRQVAEQFVDGVEGGYREDEDQDDQYQNEDSNNQGRDNNKYAINNKSEDNKEIEI